MSWKPSPSFVKVGALLALFALAPIMLSIIYYHFGGLASENEQRFQRNLRFAFMRGGDIVELAPLRPGKWVKVCAIDTGLSREDVDKVVGFSYVRYRDIRWIGRPDFWTLLFIDPPEQISAGNVVTVTPIRINRREVADLALPRDIKGVCAGRDGAHLNLARRMDAAVDATPVIARLVGFGQ